MGDMSASLAFVALHLASKLHDNEAICIGSAQLLALLIEKVGNVEEKFKKAEEELRLIKLIRAEDAKANEKVVSIFASHEQSWITERKSLKLQIRALSMHLESLKSKKEEALSNLSFRVTEAECEIKVKDDLIEEGSKKRIELEERINTMEREVEKLKNELNVEKEESKFVMEKMKNDLEQKDKILSALLRKSKIDNEEKQIMLKEVKMSKAKKKQTELEMEKWKNKWEVRSMKGSKSSYSRDELLGTNNILFENETFWTNGEEVIEAIKLLNKYPTDELDEKFETQDIQRFDDLVRRETEKYITILEQKHFTEIEAFTGQMGLKEEKLEAFRWRLISKDIESKRMQTHIEELQEHLSKYKDENLALESLLLDKEAEIKSLNDQFSTTISEVDITVNDIMAIESNCNSEISLDEDKIRDSYSEESQSIVILTNFPKQETEEEKAITSDSISSPWSNKSYKDTNNIKVLAPVRTKDRKMDIHALGVSYKIKRLKQQLLMLEKLVGMQEIKFDGNKQNLEGIRLVIHLLNKQVKRFQSLEEKTDDLCLRMNDNKQGGEQRDYKRGKEKNRVLESFLEETFQLQRYMVATGQKLMNIQSKITSNINSCKEGLDESIGFNTEQFADVINNLFREVQRGLELRIARIIGDIEGTLACAGIRQI